MKTSLHHHLFIPRHPSSYNRMLITFWVNICKSWVNAHNLVAKFINKTASVKFFSITILVLCISIKALAQTYPAGFSQSLVTTGLTDATALAQAPDGRIFVCLQGGSLRIIQNGTLLATPFVTLNVNSSGERGLLGVAIDPNFATNNYIYLYYTLATAANNRISRFTANGNVAVAGSEVVLLDLDPLSSATNHNGGWMQFGPDGNLYVGVGENANSANAQDLDTYHGKILRITKTGGIPAGNPFTTGTNQRRSVWAYGMRNPFTLSFQPGTGKLYVNDVGQATWEEINDVTATTSSTANFGWPMAEGFSTTSGLMNPVYAYSHGTGTFNGCAITGGTFFNPAATNYPAAYTGKYFFMDYCGNWINYINTSGTITATNFATGIPGAPVGIITGIDGNLYFLSRSADALYKIVYNAGSAPVITNQPQNVTVTVGQSATFSVTASGTSPLSYQWRKNGTNISGATSQSYTKTNVQLSDSGNYSVVVTNSAGSTTSNNAKLTVLAPNQLPTATISTPQTGSMYSGGQVINFSGSATDPEDGSLAAPAFNWSVVFHHGTHTHPGPSVPQAVKTGSFTIPNSGETATNVWYRLYCIVHDSQGAIDSAFVDIQPRISNITINTNSSAGLQVTIDGQPQTSPYTTASVEGIIRNVGVISPQTVNGITYTFSNWTNGGGASQTFATPVNDTTFTANFTSNLREPENPQGTVAGLNYKYYEGTWTVLPNFASLAQIKGGSVSGFDLSPRNRNDNFGFRFTGYINVPADGNYTFYTNSDDGSNLYIGTTKVVDNDGLHGLQEHSGSIPLKAGKHALRVDYFEATGSENLIVSYAGPGITKQVIPASALFRWPKTILVNAFEDAYVQGGTNAGTTFGTTNPNKLLTKYSPSNLNNDRDTYLKFDIRGLSNQLDSANLRVYGKKSSSDPTPITVQVFVASNNNWTENTLTYNNKPPITGSPLDQITINSTTGQYYEWNIKSYITSQITAGAQYVTLILHNATQGSGNIAFNSSENTQNNPKLKIVFASAALRIANPQNINEEASVNPLSEITIYPNPAKDVLNIELPRDIKNAEIMLMDLSGRKTESVTATSQKIILSTDKLNNGLYVLIIKGNDYLQSRKVIIEK